MPDRAEMISRMRDDRHRVADVVLIPRFDFGKRAQDVFVRFFHAFAQKVPFFRRDGFDQPALFPIYFFGSAVNKFADAVEIKFGVFGVRGNRRFADIARNLCGGKFFERRQNADAAVEIRTARPSGEPSKVSRKINKMSFRKSSLLIIFVILE